MQTNRLLGYSLLLRDIDADNENRRNNSGSSYNNTLTPMNPSAIQL